MRNYMRERWYARREKAVEYLGGKCVQCGSTEDLQFDHIDRSTKSFNIARRTTSSEEKFWAEIGKCQLLCKSCHQAKTITDLGNTNARLIHGTISSYRYCRCDVCRAAKSEYNRQYKLRQQASVAQR